MLWKTWRWWCLHQHQVYGSHIRILHAQLRSERQHTSNSFYASGFFFLSHQNVLSLKYLSLSFRRFFFKDCRGDIKLETGCRAINAQSSFVNPVSARLGLYLERPLIVMTGNKRQLTLSLSAVVFISFLFICPCYFWWQLLQEADKKKKRQMWKTSILLIWSLYHSFWGRNIFTQSCNYYYVLQTITLHGWGQWNIPNLVIINILYGVSNVYCFIKCYCASDIFLSV